MYDDHTGPELTEEQIRALKEELDSLGETDEEKIGIVRKAFASGWKSFYPLRKQPGKRSKKQGSHNFTQRDFTDRDCEELEKKLLKKQMEGGITSE